MSERDCARRPSTEADGQGLSFPEDFSMDEENFASELRELFPLDREELPPHFAQTLCGDEWRSQVAPGYEAKITYRVFSELDLPRSPLVKGGIGRQRLGQIRSAFARPSRPLAAAISGLLVLMVFSVLLASPAFAAGLRILVGQTGVVQVQNYPKHVGTSHTSETAFKQGPPPPTYWVGNSYGNYRFFYSSQIPQQEWSEGPITELHYVYTKTPVGSGMLDIREFRLSPDVAAVLQVVQSGSATAVDVGNDPAVYVEGAWSGNSVLSRWVTGKRSEIILEHNGVIIWIVADPRDGMKQAQLIDVAKQLQFTPQLPQSHNSTVMQVIERQLDAASATANSGEVYAVLPSDVSPSTGIFSFVSMSPDPYRGHTP